MPKFLRVLAITYIAYVALFLLILTPALNFVPHWYVKDTFGRELDTKWVLLNPFTLSLEVREASIPETDGSQFVSLETLSVNLSVEGLWQSGWVLDRLAVTGLYAHIKQLAPDQFNFDDFILASTEVEPEPETEDSELVGVTVKDLHLHAQTLLYSDQAREKPVTSQWNDLDIAVADLSTVKAEGKPYTLEVYGPSGGKLSWQGEVSIPNATSDGSLSLSELDLHTIWQVAEPWLTFEITRGKLTMEGDYAVNWGDELAYRINGGNIRMRDLSIDPKEGADLSDTGLQLASLDIQPVDLDGSRQHVEVGNINIDSLDLSGWMDEERLSLQELFAGPADPNQPVEPTANSSQESDEEAPGWTAALGQVQLADSTITWRSPFTDPAILSVTPIEASVGPLNWPLSGETSLSLSLMANDTASITTDGTLALADGAGSINYALQGLPLNWFNPNLPAALKAKIVDGALGIEGSVSLDEFAPQQIDLSGAITNFTVQIEDSDVPISGWETVRVEGVSVDMVEHHLLLQKLSIDNYSGRLHIAEDGSINTSNVWKEELGDQAEEIAEDLTDDKPWSFEIPQITMTDSEVDFMDQSLPIPFRTVIGDMNGELLGLGGKKPASVEFQGSVDGYAPVKLNGSLDPFIDPMFLDLELGFDGVDMALLSPYSSTYAGYAIDQGILNLDLKYSLQDNHLKGENKLRMDQLKLGEKVDSDKAIDAPLELALSIMTDASGVIDLQVPVSGDVNDPNFNIGGIVSKAIVNVITKAVTAPFTLLAGLVGSEEDLQRLTFSSGSAALEEANLVKLDQLNQALVQRPGLSLSITGRLKPQADRERLQKNTLKQQLADAGLAQEEIDSKGPDWDQAIAKRYRKLGLPAGETEPTSREKYLALAAQIEISDEQLLQLAEDRAVAVKTYLVNTAGLAPDRAVVAQPDLKEKDNVFSGVALGVD